MNKEESTSFLKSKKIAHIMTVIVILAGIIIVFHVGEEFGYKKAELMDNMSDNYYRAFGPGDPHKMGAFGYLFDDQTGTRHDLCRRHGDLCAVVSRQWPSRGQDWRQERNSHRRHRFVHRQRHARRADVADAHGKIEAEPRRDVFVFLFGEHVFPKLRRGFHHQGEVLLVPRP